MTDLQADPDALRPTGPRFQTVADALTAAAEALHGVLEAEGECWGHDKIAESFVQNYTPGEGEKAVAGLRDIFAGYATDMVDLANALEAQDSTISSNLGTAAG